MKKDPAKIKTIAVVDWDETIATYELERYTSLIKTQHKLMRNGLEIPNSYDIHIRRCFDDGTEVWSYCTLYPLLWALIIMYINLNETIALAIVTNSTFEKIELANFLNGLLAHCLHRRTVMEYNFSRNDFEFDPIWLNYLVDTALAEQLSKQALFREDDFAFRNRSPNEKANQPKTTRLMATIDELVPRENISLLGQSLLKVIFFDDKKENIDEVEEDLPTIAALKNRKIKLSTIQAVHYFAIPLGQEQWPNWNEQRKLGLREIIKFAQQVGVPVTAGMAAA